MAKQYTTRKIPNSTASMTLEQLPFFIELAKFEDISINDMTPIEIADLLVLFFREKSNAFDVYTPESNRRLLGEVMLSCAKHQSKPIKPSYTIDGITYEWVSDYSKVNTAFHRDVAMCDFKENPYLLLGFCYIEKGMVYNELDKSEMIKNELRTRSEKLSKVITLSDYLDIQSFFLSSYSVLKNISRRKQP